MITLEIIGSRIRLVREELLKLSQAELGGLVGVNQVVISNLEKGKSAQVQLLLELVNLLEAKGLNANLLFLSTSFFSIKTMKDSAREMSIELAESKKETFKTRARELITILESEVLN